MFIEIVAYDSGSATDYVVAPKIITFVHGKE